MSKSKLESEDNLLQHTKEHCLVGIKGAIKRGIDSHFIHANIDTYHWFDFSFQKSNFSNFNKIHTRYTNSHILNFYGSIFKNRNRTKICVPDIQKMIFSRILEFFSNLYIEHYLYA